MRPLTPYPVLDYIDGPHASDTPSLAAWLAAHDGDTHLIKLPVSMDKLGVGVGNFRVGTIAIEVSDSALGVSLADRVRSKCQGLATCRLWLEGYWSANELSLRNVGERIGEAQVCVAIEADKREGRAYDAKGGAVLKTDAGEIIYLHGLDAWPSDIHGQRVAVIGILVSRKLFEDPVVDANGDISQGAEGLQTVFESPRWSVPRRAPPTGP
jgi:hypothetical protein